MKLRLLACLATILLGTGPALAEALGDRVETALRAGLDAAGAPYEIETVAAVAEVYRARHMRPFWIDDGGVTARGRTLARILSRADLDALDPDDYGAGYVSAMIATTEPEVLAGLEIRLSVGLVRFAADLGQGRTTPHVSDPELFQYRDEVDKAGILTAAEAAGDLAAFVDGYRPLSPRYDRLRQALAAYRAMAELGGWQPIPGGPALKPGMTDPRVGLVRDRLRLWGDLAADADPAVGERDVYDDALAAAVERMQGRHGLTRDRVIGRNTLAALNVPVEDRIEQLVLNLERRRWIPDDLGPKYVYVNLADFHLKVVDRERTVYDTRVVVGRPYHRTPVFSHAMTYVEVNPYWHVPQSIAREELLPKIREDAGFLARNNYTLFSDWSAGAVEIDPLSVDWTTVSSEAFGYKIRQEPGDANALGRLKFMFPNRFNVYLHDTPAKSLFARDQRSFSHGCIRVMDPVGLAEIVLAEVPGWTLDRINETIESGRRTVVSLAEPLPVHLDYQTAWVNKDGSVHFRSDIYDRDRVLAEALMATRRSRAL